MLFTDTYWQAANYTIGQLVKGLWTSLSWRENIWEGFRNVLLFANKKETQSPPTTLHLEGGGSSRVHPGVDVYNMGS